jgi:hypothetical protein
MTASQAAVLRDSLESLTGLTALTIVEHLKGCVSVLAGAKDGELPQIRSLSLEWQCPCPESTPHLGKLLIAVPNLHKLEVRGRLAGLREMQAFVSSMKGAAALTQLVLGIDLAVDVAERRQQSCLSSRGVMQRSSKACRCGGLHGVGCRAYQRKWQRQC